MQTYFKPSFVKDFEQLPPEVREEVRSICTKEFPKLRDLREFQASPIKSLKGFKFYYRIKIGNYRIGFRKENDSVIFIRVLDRKDIYRHFPD